MINKVILASIIISIANVSNADDLRFRNGQTIKNSLIIDSIGTRVRVKTSVGYKFYPITSIDIIIKSEFDSSRTTFIEDVDGSILTIKPSETPLDFNRQTIVEPIKKEDIAYTYPNKNFISVSIIAFGLSWDYFDQVGDIQSAIDFNTKLSKSLKISVDNSSLEGQKTKKLIIGSALVVAGIINTIVCFKRVEVTATNNTLGLSYKF